MTDLDVPVAVRTGDRSHVSFANVRRQRSIRHVRAHGARTSSTSRWPTSSTSSPSGSRGSARRDGLRLDESAVVDGLVAAIHTPLGPMFARPCAARHRPSRSTRRALVRPAARASRRPVVPSSPCRQGRSPTVLLDELDSDDPAPPEPGCPRRRPRSTSTSAGGCTARSTRCCGSSTDRAIGSSSSTTRRTASTSRATRSTRSRRMQPEGLHDAMAAHHYPLQAVLYLVALHRYLRWRLGPALRPRAAPRRRRRTCSSAGWSDRSGAGSAGPTGVFAWRPATSAVLALDRLLRRSVVRHEGPPDARSSPIARRPRPVGRSRGARRGRGPREPTCSCAPTPTCAHGGPARRGASRCGLRCTATSASTSLAMPSSSIASLAAEPAGDEVAAAVVAAVAGHRRVARRARDVAARPRGRRATTPSRSSTNVRSCCSATRLYAQRQWVDECIVAAALRPRAAAGRRSDRARRTRDARTALARRGRPADAAQRTRCGPGHRRQAHRDLVGGPGSGKTYTVTGILAALVADASEARPRVLRRARCARPARRRSGCATRSRQRAAQWSGAEGAGRRLAVLDRIEPTTLHRLLGPLPAVAHPVPPRRGATRSRTTSSWSTRRRWSSLPMMARLLEALRADARLILVGDPDQLESVDAGAVLADIVRGVARPRDLRSPVGSHGSADRAVRAAHSPIGPLADANPGWVVRTTSCAPARRRCGATSGEASSRSSRPTTRSDRRAPRPSSRSSGLPSSRHAVAADHGRLRAALDATASCRILCAHRRGSLRCGRMERPSRVVGARRRSGTPELRRAVRCSPPATTSATG